MKCMTFASGLLTTERLIVCESSLASVEEVTSPTCETNYRSEEAKDHKREATKQSRKEKLMHRTARDQ